MKVIENIIRGGQLTIHSLRMFSQVFNALIFWSLVVGVITFSVKSFVSIEEKEAMGCIYYYVGEFLHSIKLGHIEFNVNLRGSQYLMAASHISTYQYFFDMKNQTQLKLFSAFILSYQAFIGFFAVFTAIFVTKGFSKSGEQFTRGARIDDFAKTKKEILKENKSKKYSAYFIAGMPYPAFSEMEHTIIIGSTGSGKTVLISDLVEQIRKRGDRAIVYDKKGDYINWFYDSDKDIILNPFDKRGTKWNLLAEIEHVCQLKPLAQSFITDGGSYSESNSIWNEAARIAFSGILEKLICTGHDLTNQEVINLVLRQDASEVAKLVRGTHAQSTLDRNSPKTAASVMFVLASYLGSLRFTRGRKEDSFSIKKWLKSELEARDSILFISSRQDLNNELSPLITAWFEIAISGILSLEKNLKQKTWVILDELPTMQKIPSLSQGLSIARSYGGCFVLGCQNIAQMREIYGKNLTEDISSECNTRVFFKTNDPDTARWMCQNIGEAEITEHKEGLSYGAHQYRDGVNMQKLDKIKSLLLPSEIQSMKKLTSFLKMPGFPIVHTKLEYRARQILSESFVPNTELINEMQGLYGESVDSESEVVQEVIKQKIELKSSDDGGVMMVTQGEQSNKKIESKKANRSLKEKCDF